ncbi:hypothetical protein [Akkermansia sp.]|nr:hypothetical protein [uncultured Akkermansia sp.]MEE0764434.1 hypothetical protein [Akkermansia sp.]
MHSAKGQNGMVRALRLRRLVNAVMVAEALCIPCFVAGVVLGLIWYGGRRMGMELPWLFEASVLAALMFLVFWGWRVLRGRMFSLRDAAALMDEQLELNAALSAGVQWGDEGMPACTVRQGGSVVRVRSWSPLAWMAAGLVLALCGTLLPLPRVEVRPALPDVPPALVQAETALNEVEKMEEVERTSVEPFREQLEALKQMSREEMYSHVGLEALDALRNKIGTAMQELGGRLQQTNEALAQSGSHNTQNRENIEEAMQALRTALEGLDHSGLRMDSTMEARLNELASASSRQIDPETLRRLQERLKHASSRLKEMCEECGMASVASPDDDPVCRNAGEGVLPGQMGISRGRGDAPLAFQPEEREKLGTRRHRVNNEDLEHTALGSVAGVEVSAPSPEEGGSGRESGGRAAQPARGGDAVWSENLTPREQFALKGIFK